MTKVFEIEAKEYNLKLAEALKEIPEISQPEWSLFIKSGPSKQRPIEDENFWHKRTASILRQIYLNKVVGVNRLRTKYGSKDARGSRPEEYKKSSGKIIRTILQQCDKAGLTQIVKDVSGVRSSRPGRQLTNKGKEFLETLGGAK